MKSPFLIAGLILLAGPSVSADKAPVLFHLVGSQGDQAVLEPVLPARFKVTRIKGDTPLTTIFPCVIIPSVGEGEHRTNILRCGSTDFAVGDVLLPR
jgi:hypothetical protein